MHYVYVMSVFDKDIQIIIKYPHTLVIIILLCQNFYLALMYMQLYAFTLLLIPPFLNWLNFNIISVHFRNIFVLKDIRVFTSVMLWCSLLLNTKALDVSNAGSRTFLLYTEKFHNKAIQLNYIGFGPLYFIEYVLDNNGF